MTELKYLKNIAESLMGIHRELRRQNEILKRHNEITASGFIFLGDTEDEVMKNEIVGDMETGQSDDV